MLQSRRNEKKAPNKKNRFALADTVGFGGRSDWTLFAGFTAVVGGQKKKE